MPLAPSASRLLALSELGRWASSRVETTMDDEEEEEEEEEAVADAEDDDADAVAEEEVECV